ncbi:MAG: PEGA domain-containing protein [Spirochaetes bacterium]|nr:PEGA domain-containing protein [Spirochaetota bacterium]
MNRINRFILVFLSLILSCVVVYLYLRTVVQEEPREIVAPLRVEVYRIDRNPLDGADIYLDQKFIGRTDQNGLFQKEVRLYEGESYTLRVERESGGYVYGPWETRFRVEAETRRRRSRQKSAEPESLPSLEGDFDILTELERAQQGKMSVYERYSFLAFLEGYMYYTVEVVQRDDTPVSDAVVIVNGKQAGNTDGKGTVQVRYSGEKTKRDTVMVVEEGEHIWVRGTDVYPDAVVRAVLSTVLLVDLYAYTEYYDSIRGIPGVSVIMGDRPIGRTNGEGMLSFTYEREEGVDGYLEFSLIFPKHIVPEKISKVYRVTKDMPKLTLVNFAYNSVPVLPKIAVFPPDTGDSTDPQLLKISRSMRTEIEDYLSVGGTFQPVGYRQTAELFRQLNIDFRREGGWKNVSLIKAEVDVLVFGSIHEEAGMYRVLLLARDYTGEAVLSSDRLVSLRELEILPEDFTESLKRVFPFEGSVTSINKLVYINLGKRFSLKNGQKLFCFVNYLDDATGGFMKRNIARLETVDTGALVSAARLDTVTEGYLLEPGMKVKRYREPEGPEELVLVALYVGSEGTAVPEANVYVDGFYRGKTDTEGKLELSLAARTESYLAVHKEGFVPRERTVKVTEKTGKLEVEMERGVTSLFLETDPPGAVVYIDGEYRGKTPLSKKPLAVPYGFHLVEIELEGYKRYKEYVNFDTNKMTRTDDGRIVLFLDTLKEAEALYDKNKIADAVSLLSTIPPKHPDYTVALELLGFIALHDTHDPDAAVEYYTKALKMRDEVRAEPGNILTYYNLAQAYYGSAEKHFPSDSELALLGYRNAIRYLSIVHQYKSRIPSSQRKNVYQNTLFYLAVANQKIYYVSGMREYLSGARYAWMSYFDFFDSDLTDQSYFKRQYAVAKTYYEEVKRLESEK